MARRKQSGEVNIGSDSFLDVIANIVGILIILIVIAGIRVGRAPVARKTAPAQPESFNKTDATVPATSNPEPLIAETKPATSEPEKSVPVVSETAATEEPEEPRFVEVTEPPKDLAQRMQTLKDEIETLEAAATANQAALKELEEQQARGELQFAKGKDKLLKEKAQFESSVKSVEQVQALIASQQASLQLMQSQLETEKKRGPRVKSLKHKVTPISRTVSSEQIHVRIFKNKISIVPIQELLEAAMRQARQHASELATARSRYGTSGPIAGYTLEYRLSAEPASVAEQARRGPGIFRISMSSFRLDPEPELREESIDEALRRGSMFDIAIQTATPGTTFTLWVYPESFSTYRALQARLHELGFTVAGRPLPLGIPISGSPDGTASAGQ